MEIKFFNVPWTQDGEDKFDMTNNKLEDILASDNCQFLGSCSGGITYTTSLTATINVVIPEDFDIKSANYIYLPEKKEGWFLSDFRFMNGKTLQLTLQYDIWSNTFGWDCFIQANAVNIQRQHCDRFVNSSGYPMDFNQNTSKVFFKDEAVTQYGELTSVDESDTLTILPIERFDLKDSVKNNFSVSRNYEGGYNVYFNPGNFYDDWRYDLMAFLTVKDKTKYEIYFRIPRPQTTEFDSNIPESIKQYKFSFIGTSLENTLLSSSYVTQKFTKKLDFNSMVKMTLSESPEEYTKLNLRLGDDNFAFIGNIGSSVECYIPSDCFNEKNIYTAWYLFFCYITQRNVDDTIIGNVGSIKALMNKNYSVAFPMMIQGVYQLANKIVSGSLMITFKGDGFERIEYEFPTKETYKKNYTSIKEDKFGYPQFKYKPSATFEYRNEPRIYLDDIMLDYYWANNISLKLPVYLNLNKIQMIETTPITNQEFSLTALSDQDRKSTNFESEFYNVNRVHRAGSNGTNALPVLIDSEVQTLSRQKSSINNQAKWDAITGGLGGAGQFLSGGASAAAGLMMGDASKIAGGTANVMGGIVNMITAPIRARQTKKATLNDIKRSPDEVSGQGGLIQINMLNEFKPSIIRKQLPDWAIETLAMYFHKYGYKAPETKILYRVLEYKRKDFNYFEIEGMGDACLLNQTFKEYYNAIFSQGVRIWWDCRKKMRDYTLPNNERFIEND